MPNNNLAKITVNDSKTYVEIFKNLTVVISYTDTKINDTIFTRELGSTLYTIENNELKLTQSIKLTNKISNKKISIKQIKKFLTMDLETQTIDNKIIPMS